MIGQRHLMLFTPCAIITLSLLWGGLVQAKEVDEDVPLTTVGGVVHGDPFTGIAMTSIPIQVPQGRNNIQPNLSLTYSSSGGNGWLGQGWKLEMGAIERQTRFGVKYTADDYVFRLSGASTDLVGMGGSDYRGKVEGFTRIRKLTAGDGRPYWEATDKKGIRYLFGQTATSRMADPADANKIFKWCLDRVEDTNGNYLIVTYSIDQGQEYLSQIDYTGNGSSSPTNQIKFYLEDRPDAPPMYVSNYHTKTAKRLKTIEIKANNSMVRAYKLTYTTGGYTARSLLSMVQQYGADTTLDAQGTVTAGTPLPAITLTWSAETLTFGSEQVTDLGNNWGDRSRHLADVNGDGKADLVYMWSNDTVVFLSLGNGSFGSGQSFSHGDMGGRTQLTSDINGDGKADLIYLWSTDAYVFLSNGDGTFAGSVMTDLGNNWGDRSRHLADVNGDGKTDLVYMWSNDTVVFLSLGNGSFGAGQFFSHEDLGGRTQLTGDVNGDGKADLLYFWSTDAYVFLSNGDGTFAGSVMTDLGNNWGDRSRHIGDVNGDGKADLVYMWSNDTVVFLSLGNGSFGAGQFFSHDDEGNRTHYATDINGDGRADLVYLWSNDSSVYLSKGDGTFGARQNTAHPDEGDMSRHIADVTGDGKADMVYLWTTTARTYPSSNPSANMLIATSNGLGGTTSISYIPSSQYVNTLLPFAIQTTASIITNDGNGNVATTAYAYSGGFHHIGERDFRGFHYVKVTGPVGPNGEQTISETWFHQGNDTAVDVNNPNVTHGYMKGKPYRVKATNNTGGVLTETTTAYVADGDGVAPFFTPPAQVDTMICDGNGCGKQIRTGYTYDAYGNVVREDQYGDLADASDDRTVARSFSPNTTAWLIDLPATETIYQGIGTSPQVAQTSFYYDGTTSCSTPSTNQTPTQGHLTRIVRWLSGGVNPEIRMAYDSYGNRFCTRDANGNITTIAYDASGTFPKIVTNTISQQTTTQYYGVDGIPTASGLYGQVKSVTDPNGAIVSHEYDVLGRPSKVTKPDGFWTTTTYHSFGTVGAQHVRADSSLGLSSWTYFDGLGRTIKKKATGPDSKVTVTETQYNVRGAVLKTSLPYFEGTGSPIWKTFIYDPLGRVLQTTNPDGTRTLACYDDWVRGAIDQNNHRKRDTRDAYGRVLRVDEYQGVYGSCDTAVGSPYATTLYQYDVLGNLHLVTDAKGNRTEMQHDTLGRKTTLKDPDMGTWTYVYDAVGNLLRQTDALEETTYFLYDALNRRTQKDYCIEKSLGNGDVVYIYDGATSNGKGRLTSMLDASGNATLFYDALGRITRTDKAVGGTTYSTQIGYDGLGRVTTVTYPDASLVNYAYNGPLLQRAYEGSINYAQYSGYNSMGQPGSLTLGNGVVTTYTYQPNTFRLATLSTAKDSTTLQNLGYVYDNGGNMTTLTDGVNGTQTFGYDEINRLTSATGPYSAVAYSYDPIGNMASNSQVGNYSYPASGSNSVQPHAVSTAGSNNYTYDANGNMTAGAGRTLVYDYENRPTSATSSGQTTTFVYDGNGGRVKKVVGGTTTTYIGKLYECETASGTTQCVKYIFAGSQRVAMKQVSTGTLDYYHSDHLGSTSVITTAAGIQEEGLTYYPYGAVRSDTGTSNVPYKYTGQELDASTGLNFYGARYYDASLGRFVSADTIVPHLYDPQALNRYAYARNNPLLYTDPTGHDFGISAMVAIAIAAAQGAATGAVVNTIANVTMAAIHGQDLGEAAKSGAISGAIKGAITGGIGADGLGWTGSADPGLQEIAINVAASTAGGAAVAAAQGHDPGEGALSGALSGAMAAGTKELAEWAKDTTTYRTFDATWKEPALVVVTSTVQGMATQTLLAAIRGSNLGDAMMDGALGGVRGAVFDISGAGYSTDLPVADPNGTTGFFDVQVLVGSLQFGPVLQWMGLENISLRAERGAGTLAIDISLVNPRGERVLGSAYSKASNNTGGSGNDD